MPDPILPDFFRAQVVFQGITGLSEDVYVNNFVFRNDRGAASSGTAEEEIVLRLTEFYNTVVTTGSSVNHFLTSQIVSPDVTIKVYDLGKPTPRLPRSFTVTMNNITNRASLPPEVATCLSYFAGRSLPRTRGRIYLGPLAAQVASVANGKHQVTALARDTFSQAATRLASDPLESVRWCVLSQADAQARLVTGGWVDDALDTQRRRGHTATVRTRWGAPEVSE